MSVLIGRQKELDLLQKLHQSDASKFVVVYGRRRVGKTFLIRQCFKDQSFTFYHTGLADLNTRDQLAQFHASLLRYTDQTIDIPLPKNWFDAFRHLSELIENQPSKEKKIIFLDELPWLSTPRSNFLSALEGFWNGWASQRNDILFIVCGSAASWMIKNLLMNTRGLHNRVNARIHLEPFNLHETEAFLNNRSAQYSRYDILQLYMAIGGIPYYLDLIDRSKSIIQNINDLCFLRNAPLRLEYEYLYRSLFLNAHNHIKIIDALSQKGKGLERSEIVKRTGISNGGGLTKILLELEESSFIRSYKTLEQAKYNQLYQLIDPYSHFYHRFIKDTDPAEDQFWINTHDTAKYYNWAGLTFEKICLLHIPQIKQSLGIPGIQSIHHAWYHPDAQIDLLIDRKDQVINVCEIKFSNSEYEIDKNYDLTLRKKLATLQNNTSTRKTLFLTFITTFGLKQNTYSGIVRNSITLDDLFN